MRYPELVAQVGRVIKPHTPGGIMKRITIERYDPAKHDDPNGPWQYSGLIEGETDTGDRWIMWLDKQGRPELFWPHREDDGAVIGDAIRLDRQPGQFSGVFAMLGVEDDADAWDENGPRNPEVVASFPQFWPDDTVFEYNKDMRITNQVVQSVMRGTVFAVVPGEGTPRERMSRFLKTLAEEFDRDEETHWSTAIKPGASVKSYGEQEIVSEAPLDSPAESDLSDEGDCASSP